MEGEIKRETKLTREELARDIAEELGCSHTIIKRTLRGSREFIPIPILLLLASRCKEMDRLLRKINRHCIHAKVNSARAKMVKVPRKISTDLAKIIGAHMADGSCSYQIVIASKEKESIEKLASKMSIGFSQSYSPSREEFFISIFVSKDNEIEVERVMQILTGHFSVQIHAKIEITEEYKDHIEIFKQWMKNVFEVEPTLFEKKDNAWRLVYSNKIIARCLHKFFDVPFGPKSSIAFEPELISQSNADIRKAFAMGVLMFDGCVTSTGKLILESNSEKLVNSVANILKKDGIPVKIRRAKTYVLSTPENYDPSKLYRYFEEKTTKYRRLELVHNVRGKEEISITTKVAKSNIERILEVLDRVKVCDIAFLCKQTGLTQSTVRTYLNIMKNTRQIQVSKKPQKIEWRFIGGSDFTVLLKKSAHQRLFRKIKFTFSTFNRFAKYLGVTKSTVSAWKLRKNRIPINMLKTATHAVGEDFESLCGQLKETNDMIVEIIPANP